MENTKLFNPSQITSARIARGMTMKELAEATGISRQMISNYESGKTVPKAENMLKIISELNFPKSFFSSEKPTLHQGVTYFRSQSAATKKVRDMQKEHLSFANMIYNKLSFYVNFPTARLPELLDKEIEDITEAEIIQKSVELRKLWGFDLHSPIKNLISTAERNGVLIVEAKMSHDKLDAVSRWIVDRPFIMLTDNDESLVRRRFNIAHELGHLILHNAVESIHELSVTEMKLLERQAHLFASHFLLPTEAFMDSLLSTSLEFFIELKKHWHVSIQAMIYKTHQLGLINDDQRLYLQKKIAWNKWKKCEPLDNELAIERPTLLKKVYEMIIDNKVLSKNELNRIFNLPIAELEKMLNVKISNEFEELIEMRPQLRLVK